MVAIKDFGMPSCCENCNMCNNRNLDTFYCCITLNDVNIDEKAHDCPLVEIEERKEGEWEEMKYRSYDPQSCETYDDGIGFRCSNCSNVFKVTSLARYHYCPNCGCKMSVIPTGSV